MLRTLTIAAAAASSLLACATAASAQEAAPASGDWSFAFGAATDNRSKDVSKTEGEPFVWGETEWENASGLFYAGGGFETIDSSGSDLEVKLRAGVRPEFAGFNLAFDVTHKWQVDADPGADDDAWEFTADVKRSIGPASGRLRVQYSPDSTGSTEAWTWVEARAGWALTDKLEASAGIGRREQDNSIDYTGWDAGFTYALSRNLEAELRYHGTDADAAAGEKYEDTVVAGITVSF